MVRLDPPAERDQRVDQHQTKNLRWLRSNQIPGAVSGPRQDGEVARDVGVHAEIPGQR